MAYYCFKCGKEVELSGGKAGRTETCPHCRADLHVCMNCRHYDKSAYNQCREPQADRVLDKDRSNFCDYFAFAADRKSGKAAPPGALKDLDKLFK